MTTKDCLYCHNAFDAYHPNRQKYCSQNCRQSSIKRPTKKKPCGNCGISFRPLSNGAKFCSIECRDVAYKSTKQTKARVRRLKKYSLTQQDYEYLLIKYDNTCAICHQPEKKMINGKLRRLAVDHCHTSGVVRGLLCFQCNVGLSNFNDNWILLDNASEYLAQQDPKCRINKTMGNRNDNT